MDQPNKKILIIAYHFPPDAAVGALRPQKFVKYLPEFGWKPFVLTIQEQFVDKQDPQRLQDVQNATVIRTGFWRTPLQILMAWRNFLKGRVKDSTSPSPEKPAVTKDFRGKAASWWGIKQLILLLSGFPDDKLGWSLPALWAGYRLVKREKISVIFATAPPHSVAIIGLLLSLITGARLVVDFRDPWVLWHRSIMHSPLERFFVHLESLCERLVITRAIRVVTTTERLTNELHNQYATGQNEKFVTISNGFDSSDFPNIDKGSSLDGKYRICYLGTLYLDRNPDFFFAALQRVVREKVISEDKLEVRLIGNVEFACGEPVKNMVRRYGLEKCVTMQGVVPHREALQYMSQADLLLLFAPNFEYQVPAKTFEYIGFKLPILALTENAGATADLINSMNAGIVVDQKDVDQIFQALKIFLLPSNSSTGSWYDRADVSILGRKQLTCQLVEMLSLI